MTYSFYTTDFEGPLDLLLHLIKESKMDIYEINIHDIIEQYLQIIHNEEKQNIDVSSEYLVMAAELIHLKSKLLVKRTDEKEEEYEQEEFSFNSEEDLKNKLIEYEKYKKLSEEFSKLEEIRSEVYTKPPESIKEFRSDIELPKGELDIEDLFNAYKNFIEREKLNRPLNTKITKKEVSVEEKITYIRTILSKKKKIEFLELFTNHTKNNVVVTFLSILEMSKNNEILLTQKDNFSPIIIEKRE